MDQSATYNAIISVNSNTGLPLNLSGYTGFSEIKKTYSSINTTSSFIVTVNAVAGHIILSMDANTSGNIVAGRYVYDVRVVDGSGNYTRIVEGILTVTPAVSNHASNAVLIEVETNISANLLANGSVDTANSFEF